MAPRPDIALPALAGDRTAAIQAALDAGPVRVVLGAGRHASGGLRLRSGTELHLVAGAELAFHADYDAFAHTTVGVVAEDSDRAMIVADGVEGVAVTGAGRILGGGDRYHRGPDADMGTLLPVALRPRVLVLESCRGVTIEGVTIVASPMWTVHLVDCEGVVVRGVTVDNDRRMPNTDGIVVDGCRGVAIEGCVVRTADDGIVLKTSARAGAAVGPCAGVIVRDCTVESRSCALKLGTESFADFRDIVFEDCRIVASNRGLGLFSRDGGAMENVRFSRIALDCREAPDGFWGSGEALTVTLLDRREGRPAGPIRGLVVEDLTGRAEGAVNLVSDRPGRVSDVRLVRIALVQEPGALGTARRYDLRPTSADLAAAPEAEGRRNAWRKGADGRVIGLVPYPGGMPGVFARGVAGLSLADVAITRPDPLPEGLNLAPIVLEECFP